MQSTGNRGNQQVTKVCGCWWFWCNLQQSHPNGFYDAGSASTEAYCTHLLLLAVLLVRCSLNNVPCHLVPFKQLFQRTCSQVKLQTVFILVLQGHCMGLPVFTILHYKKEDKEAQWCLTPKLCATFEESGFSQRVYKPKCSNDTFSPNWVKSKEKCSGLNWATLLCMYINCAFPLWLCETPS